MSAITIEWRPIGDMVKNIITFRVKTSCQLARFLKSRPDNFLNKSSEQVFTCLNKINFRPAEFVRQHRKLSMWVIHLFGHDKCYPDKLITCPDKRKVVQQVNRPQIYMISTFYHVDYGDQ